MATRKHDWLKARSVSDPAIVLRIDDYRDLPRARGQFLPAIRRDNDPDAVKAIWPSVELAQQAAEWAATKFGHQYAVFKMVSITEQSTLPLKTTKVGA